MTDWNAVSAFMANVVPWPGSPSDPGHVGLWYSMPNTSFDATKKVDHNNKKQFISGWPYRAVDQFVSRVGWVIKDAHDKFKDVWFCTSLQKKDALNKKGKPKAQKHAVDALKMRSIWVDIDVKADDPKCYASRDEAWREFSKIRQALNLPRPSAVVSSGGGLQVWWISATDLLLHEWAPYAQGLKNILMGTDFKFDPTCTADAARLMRVPGTFNYKYDPPAPVELLPLPLKLYDFAELDFLKKHAGVATAKTASAHQLFVDDAAAATFANGPAFKIEGEPDLQAGIDKFGDNLLDPLPIFQQCGFYKEALLHGGKNNDNPQWNLAVLGTTFMEDGDVIAHRISSSYATYSKDDTQTLYDRKLVERTERGIGYPSCATIKGAGCKACETCPLFKQGKSPLNIRPVVTATVSGPGVVGTAIPDDYYMPDGFELNDKGIICKIMEERDEDDNVKTWQLPLFQSVMDGFWLEKGGQNSEALNFTTTVDKGFTEQVAVPLGEINKNGFLSWLGLRRVLIDRSMPLKPIQEFFLSTIGKLRAAASAHTAVPFGWYEENGVRLGFVYGGKVMLDDGTERPCGTTDPNIARKYAPTGTLAKWMDAAKTITDRKRPELNTIILTSFMSPLLELVGRETCLFSSVSYGSDSGAGKSSSFKIGTSVWGHPLLTKGTETQTPNNITTIMKTIRNLPFYWDEITNEEQQEKVAKVLHEADGGKEKGRNLDGSRTQVEGTWALAIHYASNISLVSFLRRRNTTHDASINRVLEWEVKKVDGGPGTLADADATMRLNETYRNYGHMGLKYAKFLSLNHKQIAIECRDKITEVQNLMRGGMSQRYWYTGVGLMIQAAKYAQMMGLDIDPEEIETFLYKIYAQNEERLADHTAGDIVENAETILTRYLKERDAQERGIWTNYMHNQIGRPPKPVTVLKNPSQPRNYQGGVEFRFAVENKQLIIARNDFDKWLVVMKHADNLVYSGLMVTYNTSKQRLAICSGLTHDPGREPCLVLNITEKTPLWDYMTTFIAPEEKQKLADDEPIPDVETGIVTDTVTGLATAESVKSFVEGATGAAGQG